MLPRYLKNCIRLGTPVRDWYEREDCVLERYEKVLAERGEAEAKKWARSEALWFLIEGGKRLFNPVTWVAVARGWLG